MIGSEMMSEPREKPLNELLTRSLVDLYVGPENTHWVLHEKLLCARSAFFHQIFIKSPSSPSQTKSFGLPDEDEAPFGQFIGWLYSGTIRAPRQEADLTAIFDLYLMAEKWCVPALEKEVLDVVRAWYRDENSYPGLRRVQYIYANTEAGSPMRALVVNSVARMLALGEGIPRHWDKALRKNGQLAVDIIQCVQDWKLDPDRVPDLRGDGMDAVPDPEDREVDEEKLDAEVDKVFQQNGLGDAKSSNDASEPKVNGVSGTDHENSSETAVEGYES